VPWSLHANPPLLNRNAIPGRTILQAFLRNGGGDFVRSETVIIASSWGTVSLSATMKALGAGEGPYWVEVFTNQNIDIERFTSSFSGHLVY
jgi:hypothetical protein